MDDFYLVWENYPDCPSPLDADAYVLPKEFNEVSQNDMTHLVTWRARRFSTIVGVFLADRLTDLQTSERFVLKQMVEVLIRTFFGLELISFDSPPEEALLAGIQLDEYGDKYLDQGTVERQMNEVEDLALAIQCLIDKEVIEDAQGGRYYFRRPPFKRVQVASEEKVEYFLGAKSERPDPRLVQPAFDTNFRDEVETLNLLLKVDEKNYSLEMSSSNGTYGSKNASYERWRPEQPSVWAQRVFPLGHGLTRLVRAEPLEDEDGMTDPERLGRWLFKLGFDGEYSYLFESALERCRLDRHTRLRLVLTYAPIHEKTRIAAGFPWELIADGAGFLLQSPKMSLVHRPRLLQRPNFQPFPRPLRIAVVKGYLGSEKNQLTDDMEVLEQIFAGVPDIRIEPIEIQTANDLKTALLGGRYHMVHVYGHGPGLDDLNGGVLLPGNGIPELMTAAHWGDLFRSVHPQLVYFNVCGIYRPGHDNGMGNDTDLATACLKAGVSNLVCLQSPQRDDRLCKMMAHFYDAVSRGFPFDMAMAEARAKVSGFESDHTAWAFPMVFMRSDDHDRVTFDDQARPHPARIK